MDLAILAILGPANLGWTSNRRPFPCRTVVGFPDLLLWLWAPKPHIIMTGHRPAPDIYGSLGCL